MWEPVNKHCHRLIAQFHLDYGIYLYSYKVTVSFLQLEEQRLMKSQIYIKF